MASKQSKEASKLIRQCKLEGRKVVKEFTLQDLVATQLNEEMMEKFNISKKSRDNLRNFQSEYCKKTKLKEYKRKLTPLYPEVPKFNTAFKNLRSYANQSPITKMSSFQELAIRKRVSAF